MKKITLFLIFTTNLIFSQIPNFVPANGLVGWWPFSGNGNDISGNVNNGIINGPTLTTDRFGVANSAYLFNGLNNYIELGNIFGLSQNNGVSMSAWIFWNGSNGIDNHQYIFQIASNPNGAITISDTGNLAVNVLNCNCVNDTNISTTINQNTWYHIVLTYDLLNGIMKMYLNGNLINTSQENMYTYYTVNNTPSRFGNYHFNSHYFKGAIDEGALWNRALTQTEITALYTGVLSSETFSNTTNFQLYPNPANDFMQFKSSETVEKISIYNTLGQLVQENKTNSLEGAISIEYLAQGSYFVKVNNQNTTYTLLKK